MSGDTGYRIEPAAGPRIRSDVVDVYIFQRSARAPAKLHSVGDRRGQRASGMDSDSGDAGAGRADVYFLQVLRSGPPLADSWHPVMGHIEAGETAVEAMWRELREELGIDARGKDAGVLRGVWALEQVHPCFIAELNAIVMSPRFAAEITPGWSPMLNDEHSDWRWVHARDVADAFMWPGQIGACREIVERLLPEGSLMRERVRVE